MTFFILEAIRGARVDGFAWVRRLMRIEEVVQAPLCLQPLVTNDLSKRTLRPTSSLTIDQTIFHTALGRDFSPSRWHSSELRCGRRRGMSYT